MKPECKKIIVLGAGDHSKIVSATIEDKKKYELEITRLSGVSSQYIQVQAQVQMGNVTHNLKSNLKRHTNSSIEVLSRSPGID